MTIAIVILFFLCLLLQIVTFLWFCDRRWFKVLLSWLV